MILKVQILVKKKKALFTVKLTILWFPVPTLLRIFIDFWLANMCFSKVQNILQSSPDGNVTLSILNYVPSIRDAGKYMACRAENSELPDATLEDGWKLEIHCK